ncbi:hypothetical protein AVEN_41621-1 [Araneus ventricosus]|uniref:Uncharacterized protein n=1 Tax=Araneus ventricosus TaxID=182803 RepID=A0A4Y2VU15_ARAVE|nr:hypothetical protein AVEN_41621-1 [Araneus ventricosus]
MLGAKLYIPPVNHKELPLPFLSIQDRLNDPAATISRFGHYDRRNIAPLRAAHATTSQTEVRSVIGVEVIQPHTVMLPTREVKPR